jgi:hypothetical protein
LKDLELSEVLNFTRHIIGSAPSRRVTFPLRYTANFPVTFCLASLLPVLAVGVTFQFAAVPLAPIDFAEEVDVVADVDLGMTDHPGPPA